MGLLGILFGCSEDFKPYKNESPNEIYNLLFAEYKYFKKYEKRVIDFLVKITKKNAPTSISRKFRILLAVNALTSVRKF